MVPFKSREEAACGFILLTNNSRDSNYIPQQTNSFCFIAATFCHAIICPPFITRTTGCGNLSQTFAFLRHFAKPAGGDCARLSPANA